MSNAAVTATVTGSTRATYVVERRLADGTLVVESTETYAHGVTTTARDGALSYEVDGRPAHVDAEGASWYLHEGGLRLWMPTQQCFNTAFAFETVEALAARFGWERVVLAPATVEA